MRRHLCLTGLALDLPGRSFQVDAASLVGRVVDMDLSLLTRRNAEAGVIVDAVDVSGLDDAALNLRLRLVVEPRNYLDGCSAEVVAERIRRTGAYGAANLLRAELRQSGQQAQRAAQDAEQLQRLVVTRDAPLGSRINSEHALILRTAVQSGPLD